MGPNGVEWDGMDRTGPNGPKRHGYAPVGPKCGSGLIPGEASPYTIGSLTTVSA